MLLSDDFAPPDSKPIPKLGAPHHRPHFHAVYQEFRAVFALDPIECINGTLPRTQQRLVEAWAEIHRDELLNDWALLQSGRPPLKRHLE